MIPALCRDCGEHINPDPTAPSGWAHADAGQLHDAHPDNATVLALGEDALAAARAALRFEVTVDSGGEDVYGWAFTHALDALELATLADVALPAETTATFRPSPGLSWEGFTEDSASASLLTDAWNAAVDTYGPHAADAALRYWCRVLTRYLRLPAVAALADA